MPKRSSSGRRDRGVNRKSTLFADSPLMNFTISTLIDLVARAGAILLVANEIRGILLTAPVFYALYAAGGTAMALWLAFCSLSGIALSLVVPLFMARRVQKLLNRRRVDAS